MLINQLWLPLFSILLISLAVRLHHALSLRFTSIFPASWQSLKASESYTKKAFDRNNEVIIIIIITIIILQKIFVYCMLWFFHICCATITVITINLFLEHFFNSLIPEGF